MCSVSAQPWSRWYLPSMAEYEQMMADSSAKRTESTKQIEGMKGGKADAEEASDDA